MSIHSLVPAIESGLLPRESEMISAVLRNVVKDERGKYSLTSGGECQVKESEDRVFGGNVILKGEMIGSRSRLADLKRKLNVLRVRK